VYESIYIYIYIYIYVLVSLIFVNMYFLILIVPLHFIKSCGGESPISSESAGRHTLYIGCLLSGKSMSMLSFDAVLF